LDNIKPKDMKSTSIHPEINKVIDFKVLKITSPAFEEGGLIPSKYTCEGEDISPALSIEHVPEEAMSLAVIVDDPDAPSGVWVHWVVWNIPMTHLLKENAEQGIQGTNDFRKQRYNGPCPPKGTHRYSYKVYALNSVLDIAAGIEKSELERAMASHIIAFGELTGRYERFRKQ
jgi:Raf kinase inhibitor-like YbhB/YbcL family protein